MPKFKFTPFLPFETVKTIDKTKQCNEPHIRITKSMFDSPAFKKLNGNEIKIYMKMKLLFFKSYEKHTDFEYSKSLGVKHLELSDNSEKSIRRALLNLVKYGFIEKTYISKGGGKTKPISNRYKFSENWKSYI